MQKLIKLQWRSIERLSFVQSAGSLYFFYLILMLTLSPNLLFGQTLVETKIESFISSSELFGRSIDVSGNYMVAGSAGAIHIFEKDISGNWSGEQVLNGPDFSNFVGSNVSILGEEVFFGNINNDLLGTSSGSVHTYNVQANSGSGINLILASNGQAYDAYGWHTNMTDGNLIVTAKKTEITNEISWVYIYEKDANGTWTKEQILTSPEGHYGDKFGMSSAIFDDLLVIGAYKDSEEIENSGAVFVYNRDDNGQWVFSQKINAFDAEAGANFGYTVAVFDEEIIIGAYRDNTNGTNAGAVYSYRKNEQEDWVFNQKLLASDGNAEDLFGNSLSVSNGYLAVGAKYDDDTYNNAGAVYLFERGLDGDWAMGDKLVASDPANAAYFGSSVVIEDDELFISAPSVFLSKSGAIYVHTLKDFTNTRTIEKSNNILLQNSPNPFNEYTIIRFHLEQSSGVAITITDSEGRQVRKIEEFFPEGENELYLSDLDGSGVFYYSVEYGEVKQTKKMLKMK